MKKHPSPLSTEWFRGVVVPLVTPLTRAGRLDLIALRRLVAMQVRGGTHVLFVAGSVGEGPMMPTSMRTRLVREVVRLARGKLPVVAGALCNSVAQGEDQLRELADLGVEAGVLTLPYYGWNGRPKQEIEFFTRLADRSPIPVVPYNLPRVTGRDLDVEVMRALFHHPNILGMKNSGNDAASMLRIVRAHDRPKRFRVLIGNSILAGEMIRQGADGIVSVHSNLFPELVSELWLAATGERPGALPRLQEIVTGLQEVLKLPNNTGGLKAAMELRGICQRWALRPWPEAAPSDRKRIRTIVKNAEACYRAYRRASAASSRTTP